MRLPHMRVRRAISPPVGPLTVDARRMPDIVVDDMEKGGKERIM